MSPPEGKLPGGLCRPTEASWLHLVPALPGTEGSEEEEVDLDDEGAPGPALEALDTGAKLTAQHHSAEDDVVRVRQFAGRPLVPSPGNELHRNHCPKDVLPLHLIRHFPSFR